MAVDHDQMVPAWAGTIAVPISAAWGGWPSTRELRWRILRHRL